MEHFSSKLGNSECFQENKQHLHKPVIIEAKSNSKQVSETCIITDHTL